MNNGGRREGNEKTFNFQKVSEVSGKKAHENSRNKLDVRPPYTELPGCDRVSTRTHEGGRDQQARAGASGTPAETRETKRGIDPQEHRGEKAPTRTATGIAKIPNFTS